MKKVRGGPRDTVRTRGSIEEPTAITPVFTKSSADLQGARRSAPRAPTRSVGVSLQERRSAELRKLQRARLAKRLWTLGERVEFELVEHLIATFDLDEDAVIRIEQRFAGLDLEALRALGADRLPPSPLHQVRR
jgi:hypothetical protein